MDRIKEAEYLNIDNDWSIWEYYRAPFPSSVTDRELVLHILKQAYDNRDTCKECRNGIPPHGAAKGRKCLIQYIMPKKADSARQCAGFRRHNALRLFRESKGVKRAELARRLGLSTGTVANYESDRRRFRIDTLKKYAAALGINRNDLIEYSGL